MCATYRYEVNTAQDDQHHLSYHDQNLRSSISSCDASQIIILQGHTAG